MKRSNDKSGFGAPKPLPGQAGHNVSESSLLEKEAKEMESRLQMLQDRMKQQQLDDTKSGGTKWKSSSKEKGGVGTYAKELQEKHKKRSEADGGGDPVLRATATGRRIQRENSASVVKTFRNQDIEFWSVSDVGDWLSYIQLPQYAEMFTQNEINGQILLDVTLEDLDYMNITVLGHRKVILKGAEELRKHKRISNLSSESLPTNTSSSNTLGATLRTQSASRMSSSMDDQALLNEKQISLSASSSSVAKTTHWSQLEPLSSNQVVNSGVLVNPADGDIDEEAERQAFMEAVSQWRQSGTGGGNTSNGQDKPKMKIEREYETKGKKSFASNSENAQSNMWVNPFAPTAVNESKKGFVVNDSDEEEVGPQSRSPRGTSLGEGTLDEAKEHEEFARAVEMWRTGNASGGGSDATGHTKKLAAQLEKELDDEQQQSVERLRKQRVDAEMRLKQASAELELMRNNIRDSSQEEKYQHIDEDIIASRSPTKAFTYSTVPSASKSKSSSADTKPTFDDEDDEDALSPVATPRNEESGNIAVALVESKLLNGTDDDADAMEESCYVVEYDSD